LHTPSLQSPEKALGRTTRQSPSHPSPADLTCSAADPSSHRSTSQLRSPPQIASTLAVDCPAGAITTRMGRVESAEGPKSYKHRDDLKLPASASQDPGAQLIFQLQIADCRLQIADGTCTTTTTTALYSPIVRRRETRRLTDGRLSACRMPFETSGAPSSRISFISKRVKTSNDCI
jgi:hypothetical protein